jgi:DoxX-like protein
MVNLTLWIVQGFLALFFLGAAIPKITGRGLQQWIGFSALPHSLVISIGIAEVLGAAGLVLPMATGILPWLTPLAAIGLAINVLMASGFHIRGGERLNAIETTLWASIAAIIAIGRWDLVRVGIPPGFLAGALTLMVPSAIVIVIVLLRRPLRYTAAPHP